MNKDQVAYRDKERLSQQKVMQRHKRIVYGESPQLMHAGWLK
jgi:hypothetical protein